MRPNLKDTPAPQLLKDLISRCWNADPEKRPAINELKKILGSWRKEIEENHWKINEKTEFYQQYQAIEAAGGSKHKLTSFSYQTHSGAIYTSRLLDFKNLPQPQNSKEINDQFYNLQIKTSELSTQLIELQQLVKETNTTKEQKSVWENLAKTEQKKRNDFKKALELLLEKSEELEEIIVSNQLLISEETQKILEKIKELKNKSQEKDSTYQELARNKSQKENELKELKKIIITNNHLEADDLEDILEAQEDFLKNNNSKRLERTRKKLAKIISETEINNLCQKQAEITQLAIQLEENNRQGEKQLTKIINTITVGDITVQGGNVLIGNEVGNNVNLSYIQEKEEILEAQTKRQLSVDSQNKDCQVKIKLFKAIEEKGYQDEPMPIDNNQSWTNHHFTPSQAQDWININPPSQQNQATQEPAFYAWLRDTKNLTPEQVLNHSDLNALKQEYQATQQTAHTLHQPN